MNRNLKILLDRHWGVYLSVIVILLIIIGYGFSMLNKSEGGIFSREKESNNEISEHVGVFNAPSVTAENVIVWDVRAGKSVYEKNSSVPKPLASITKVMTALTALESVPKNTTVTIDYNSLAQDGNSNLIAGEKWLLKDLIDFSLVESSNDGIAAVASAVGAISDGSPGKRNAGRVSFIDMMNQKARELDLGHMSFVNESGLDIYNETEAGAFGSAEDVAKLFSYVLTKHPDLFEATTHKDLRVRSLTGNTHIAKNTNNALAEIPALIGSKTGYTDISGGNLGVILDPGINYPMVIIVLGSTFEDRFKDVVALSEATLDYFSSDN